MTNNERIDAYFRNELSETEKQQLLDEVKTDSSLNSEFKFQKSITDGIRAHRKQELIAKLNSVQIASTSQSLILKSIGIVGIATIATIGTYMWMNKDADPNLLEPVENVAEVITEQTEDDTNNSTVAEVTAGDESLENETLEVIEEEATDTATPLESTTAPNRTAGNSEAEVVVPNIVVPDVQEPESGESMTGEEDLNAPEAMSTSSVTLSTRNDVEVKLSKKYTFHYQIVDEALVLYGNFNESPFEVIELKTNEGINSYLFFKENFYSLLTDSKDIRPLNQIENKELIKELQKRR